MAIHASTTGAPLGAPISSLLKFLDRHAIADEIERLVALLDAMDGDIDLEPEHDRCSAGDDGCGPVRDCYGHLRWGSNEEERGQLTPIYGLDQSRGPTNYFDASRARKAEEMGLVRSPTGGWHRQEQK